MEDEIVISEELREHDDDTVHQCTVLDRIIMYMVIFLIISAFIGSMYILKTMTHVS